MHPCLRPLWAASGENLSSGFPTKRVSNQSSQLHRLARKLKFLPVASLLSKKRITKALIRLRGCADWSAPVMFANPQRQVFSRQGPYNLNPFSVDSFHFKSHPTHFLSESAMRTRSSPRELKRGTCRAVPDACLRLGTLWLK